MAADDARGIIGAWKLLAAPSLAMALATLVAAQGPDFGMHVPRPVDAKEREALGYPPPRKPEAILALIDALDRQYLEFGDDPVQHRRIGAHNTGLSRQRIDLISELEEAGYAGPRLADLVQRKVEEIRAAWSPISWPYDRYGALRRDLVRRHSGTPAAARAAADDLYDLICLMKTRGLTLDDAGLEKVAAAETARRDADAGHVLLTALQGREPALRERWFQWIERNLPEDSLGRRHVVRQRAFGNPIRLEGTGFDGERIDTAAWKGDVILVDFWGTWCRPCKEAMPELAAVHGKLGSRGLRIVGVLCDDKVDEARTWLREQGYSWPQLVDRTLTAEDVARHPIARRYAIGGFPTLWIIDRRGVLREDAERGNLEVQVLRFLDEPGPDK